MKKILLLLMAVILMFAGYKSFSATYTIPPARNNATQTQTTNECDIPPYSSTVSPYTTRGNCPVNTQQYSQQQVQPPIQQGLYFDQNRQFTGHANTLAELPLGSIVMDPNSIWNFRYGENYSGKIEVSHPVLWRKLEDNHYAQNSALLLSEPIIAEYPFCHQNKGLRAWDESDVRRFLRTTFYNHLSDGFKNAIVNVSIPYADMYGNPKTITDNFFILSIVEWGLSDRKNNGTVIKYYDLPSIYHGYVLQMINNKYGMYRASWFYNWTRTINKPEAKGAGYTNEVFTVSKEGVLETVSSSSGYRVRPAVNIKSTTRVSGPYQIISTTEPIIYYILEF